MSVRTPKAAAIFRVQDRIMRAASGQLAEEGFTQVRPPILSSATDPGLRGAARAKVDFYGKPYYVTSSMIMHKQMLLPSLGKLYAFSPCVRLEPPHTKETGRHLAEFAQIDLEWADASMDDAMGLAERVLAKVATDVRRHCTKELETIGVKPRGLKTPFARLTHKQAVDTLRGLGFDADYGEEIPWDGERLLSLQFDQPFWITHYPDASRGFYDKLGEASLLDFDLIYPGGYGEAISGGEREHTPEGVKQQMRKTGIDPLEYGWYFELLEAGIPPSAGFGIGLERLTRWICELDHVHKAGPFTKVAGVHSA